MKVLWLGDLHLYDKEITSTKGYVENNMVVLNEIYKYVEENDDIELVIFSGDIQHKTPTKLKESYKWRKWFEKFGELLLKREEEKGTKYQVGQREGQPEGLYPIYSLRGNHDNENKFIRKDDFTFFDELVQEGLLQNPEYIRTEDNTVFEFRNYGEIQKQYDKQDGEKLVTLVHDVVYHKNSKGFLRMLVDLNEDTSYSVEEYLNESDVVIVGHIHTPGDNTHIQVGDKSIHYILPGSIGRTSREKGHLRDVGYGVEVDTNTLDLEVIEIKQLSVEEFFDIRKITQTTEERPDFSDFTLDTGELSEENYTPTSAILEMEGVDSRVKERAIELLEEGELNNDK